MNCRKPIALSQNPLPIASPKPFLNWRNWWSKVWSFMKHMSYTPNTSIWIWSSHVLYSSANPNDRGTAWERKIWLLGWTTVRVLGQHFRWLVFHVFYSDFGTFPVQKPTQLLRHQHHVCLSSRYAGHRIGFPMGNQPASVSLRFASPRPSNPEKESSTFCATSSASVME